MSGDWDRAECDYEPMFKDLLPVLGDKAAQDEIRSKKPGKHCPALEANPDACRTCKLDANPFKDNIDFALLYVENEELASEAYELYTLWRLGGLDSVKELTPGEFAALAAADKVNEAMRIKAIGVAVGNVVGQMFAGPAKPKEKL